MLRRIVDLREGEGRALLSTSAILALVTGAHTILETARDTLFLSKLPPARLAWVYVMLAALSLVAGALSSAISKRFGRRAGFVVTLGLCAYLIVLLYLRDPTPALVFVLYVTSGVIGTILTMQFWLFAGQLFTVSQGKRLFGPMAAGGVLGATLGATAAAVLLRFASAGTLLFTGAALFLAAGVIATLVPAAEGIDDIDLSPTRAFTWLRDISLLKTDRYVAIVGALVTVSTATVLLADFLFKSTAAATYGPEKLGPFLGTYYAIQNGIALVVQVFLTGPLVRRLGVTTTLLLFPLLVTAGGVGVIATGAFSMALAVKATDGSLRHSLHRVTSELLLLPLPGDVRDRAKRLNDTMLGRGSQAVAATAIVGLSAFGLADARTLGTLVTALAIVWVVVALALRAPYLDVFRRALARGELPEGDQDLDLSAMETILESLASADEGHVIAAIDLLASTKRHRLLPALILYHESPAVLERALAVFAAEPRRDFIDLGERLLGHPEPAVRAAAVQALAAAGRRRAAELALKDADPGVHACAAFFLATDTPEPQEDPRIAAMFADKVTDGPKLRAALLGVIGDHGDERWGAVVRAIVAKDAGRRSLGSGVAAAIRRTRQTALARHLVEQLVHRDGRAQVWEALVSLGQPAFDALRAAFEDPASSVRLRRQIPRAIAVFATQESVDMLVAGLEKEPHPAVRYRMLRALGRLSTDAKAGMVGRLKFDRVLFEKGAEASLIEYLQLFETVVALETPRVADRPSSALPSPERPSSYPPADGGYPVTDVLIGLLRDRIASALERSFRFLQLAHRNEDIEGVHHAVVRGDRRARSTALEFLDVLTIGESNLRSLLRVVVDDLEPTERARRARPLIAPDGSPPADHDTAIIRLIHEDDNLIAALAAGYAAEANLPDLVMAARQEVEKRPELLRLGGADMVPRLELSHA